MTQLLRLKPGMKVADVGCGIGDPLVTIARATGASITGINNNAHQIARGKKLVHKARLGGSCRFLLANFMDVPLEDGYFDAIYAFESICHAPDTDLLFHELYRLLKPGGEIAAIDWCLTERFDEGDERHRDIRDRIELGNATFDLRTTQQQVFAAQGAGFDIIAASDLLATEGDECTPWYMALQSRDFSLSSIARMPVGRRITTAVVGVLERLRIAPLEMAEAAQILNIVADALVEGGETGIMTPGFLVHARKPGSASASSI